MTPPEPVEAIVSRFNDEIEDGDPELAAGSLLFAALLGPSCRNWRKPKT